VTDRIEVRRLSLRVERASLARTNLRMLLASADTALAELRQELRSARARDRRLLKRPYRPERP